MTPELVQQAQEMGLTPLQIIQANTEHVETILGLRRIEKNSRDIATNNTSALVPWCKYYNIMYNNYKIIPSGNKDYIDIIMRYEDFVQMSQDTLFGWFCFWGCSSLRLRPNNKLYT